MDNSAQREDWNDRNRRYDRKMVKTPNLKTVVVEYVDGTKESFEADECSQVGNWLKVHVGDSVTWFSAFGIRAMSIN